MIRDAETKKAVKPGPAQGAAALYFLALVLPPPLDRHITLLKKYFLHRYGCRAALRSPPHITLHMPFRWKEARENKLVQTLQCFAEQQPPVYVKLQNYGCFPPRVIYVNVVKTPELERLHRQLTTFCRTELNLTSSTWRNGPFNPHVTLAFRDLKKAHFAGAWQALQHRKFEGVFTARGLSLLKHNGTEWQEWQVLPFASGG